MWLANAPKDARIRRVDLARESGLQDALVFPVRAGGRVVAVLDFASRRMRQPEQRLLQTLSAIGTQIGQFLGRVEAERAVRDSEARFRAPHQPLLRLVLGARQQVLLHAPGRPQRRRRRPRAAEAPDRPAALGHRHGS
jgi:GAF domain-containing protein